MTARLRPLLVRPGVRYACHDDGLCCTDVHVLGPVSRTEAKRLRVLDSTAVGRSEALEVAMLRTQPDGHCLFHVPDASDGARRLCVVHAEQGSDAKPASCRRFPIRLIATPTGGRIATEHRCPCRTMGDRPLLDAEKAGAALLDPLGRLQADARVEGPIAATARKKLPFARWLELEAVLLARLASGHEPLDVLAEAPWPRLHDLTWSDVGHLFRQRPDGSACGEALAWLGDELLRQQGTPIRPQRQRPWSPAFDNAEARTPTPQDPAAMLADWVADQLFSLDWHGRAPLDVTRAELATRVELARGLAQRFVGLGTRADRAMAEAILIVELGGASLLWGKILERVRLGRA